MTIMEQIMQMSMIWFEARKKLLKSCRLALMPRWRSPTLLNSLMLKSIPFSCQLSKSNQWERLKSKQLQLPSQREKDFFWNKKKQREIKIQSRRCQNWSKRQKKWSKWSKRRIMWKKAQIVMTQSKRKTFLRVRRRNLVKLPGVNKQLWLPLQWWCHRIKTMICWIVKKLSWLRCLREGAAKSINQILGPKLLSLQVVCAKIFQKS